LIRILFMLAASAFFGTALLSLGLSKYASKCKSSKGDEGRRVSPSKSLTVAQNRANQGAVNGKVNKQATPKENKTEDALNLTKEEPAVNGHHYGNFHEYYNFHKCEDRCSSLSTQFFVDIWEHCGRPTVLHLLDVGCNEGDLTSEVLKEAKKQLPSVNVVAVGVDLDSVLIQRANNKYKNNSSLHFATIDVMEENSLMSYMSTLNIKSFALVSCFSITMWIHMNHGDEGLLKFLHLMGSVSNCSVLLEPQLWKSYRKANERCRRRGIPELPYFTSLTIKDMRKHCIEFFTTSFDMTLQQSNDTPGWNRPLLLFSFKPLSTNK